MGSINFGTSFATPTAAAALANYLNTAIAEFNASGSSISDIDVENFEPINQTDFTNSIIEAISRYPIVVDDNGNRYQYAPKVLNETLDSFGLTPTKANRIIYKIKGNDVINVISQGGIDGVSVPIVSASEFVNRPATFTDVSF